MSQNPFSMLTPDTPLKPLIVCASGCEVQLRVALCLCSLPCSPLHLLIECCFEMLTLYKRKRKCKKKNLKHTQANPYELYLYIHVSVQVYVNKN